MSTYFIRSSDLAVNMARRLSKHENGNKVLDGRKSDDTKLERDSRRGCFESLRLYKETKGGFSFRIQNILNRAVER